MLGPYFCDICGREVIMSIQNRDGKIVVIYDCPKCMVYEK